MQFPLVVLVQHECRRIGWSRAERKSQVQKGTLVPCSPVGRDRGRGDVCRIEESGEDLDQAPTRAGVGCFGTTSSIVATSSPATRTWRTISSNTAGVHPHLEG